MNFSRIWVAWQAWADNLENHPSAAFGYKPVGFFLDAVSAHRWVEIGGRMKKHESWTMAGAEGTPKRKVTALELLNVSGTPIAQPHCHYCGEVLDEDFGETE